MCGICGIVNFSEGQPDESCLKRMNQTLFHRGPDQNNIYVKGPAGLGHTRLSIIDLTETGSQPMQSPDKQVTLVYNGEIYNFSELRHILEKEGVKFIGRSDTEVVLHAYIRWGKEFISRLNGMFAFAIWDEKKQELLIARDRFGIKPLYYTLSSNGIVFGSEIKAILAANKTSHNISLPGLHEFFYYGTGLGVNTLFKDIFKLLPGHFLTFNSEGITLRPYWQIENIQASHDTIDDATEKISQHLEQSVKAQLVSDVPVGIFLSGGIDSSCITAFASKHYQGRLQTFSAGFDYERGVNELPKARKLAKHFGTQHHEIYIEGKNLPDIIEKLILCHDQPFSDAANIPLYLLCEKLAGNPKVILQGDGGDEVFAGYRRYNVLLFHRFWHGIAKAENYLKFLFPKNNTYRRIHRFLAAMGNDDPAIRMALLLTEETPNIPPIRILSESWRKTVQKHDPFLQYRQLNKQLEHTDIIQRMLHTDMKIILPDIFLEKVDKSTMAHGIEVRVPMLDNRITDYMLGLPSSYKVRKGQKKWILRRALRGIVPDEILDAPKTGFGVPYSYWLKEPLSDYLKSVLWDAEIQKKGLFDLTNLNVCIKEHISGRYNNGFLLWKALNLALWCKKYGIQI